MPRPLTDRQRWREELLELAEKAAKHRAAFAALPASDRVDGISLNGRAGCREATGRAAGET